MMKTRRFTKWLSTLCVCSILFGCASANPDSEKQDTQWPKKIVLVQMPNENNPAADSQHEKFGQALSEYLGIEVEAMEASEYTAAIEGMAGGNIDVMLVSPMSYFQAKERAGAELLVSTPMSAEYVSAFIVRSDRDDITGMEDLRGKTFAFVDQASSSGYLYPKAALVKQLNLDPDQLESSDYFFKTVAFSGSHTTSVSGVQMGDYDAACVAKSIIAQMAEADAVNAEDFKIIGSSDIIPNPAYVARGSLPEDLKAKIKAFFLSYKDADYFEAVHGNRDIRFVEVTEDDYQPAKEMLDLLHIEFGD